jgi:hypothetical protein
VPGCPPPLACVVRGSAQAPGAAGRSDEGCLHLLTPLVAGVAGIAGVAETPAVAAPGSPAAVAVRFALAQLGKPYRWGADPHRLHLAPRAARQGDQAGGRPTGDTPRRAGRTQQRRGRRPAAPGRERPMPDRRRRVRSPDPRRRHGLPAQPRPHPRRRRRERAPGASSSPTAASAAQPAASSPARRSSDGVQAAWRCRRCRGRRWGGVALHRPPGSRWSCQPPSWTAR